MFGDFPRDPQHVGRFPCEDVLIFDEELDERVLLSLVQVLPYVGGFALIILLKPNLLRVLTRRKRRRR